MKALLSLLLLFTFSTAFAVAPHSPESESRFQQLEKGSVRLKKFVYDFSVHGGAVSTIGLGEYLPANSVIVRSWLFVVTQLADGGTGTLAFQCEDANNVKTATDMTGSAANAIIEGASTGAASAFVGAIAADCQISAVIGGAAITAGKMRGYVEYILNDDSKPQQ